jgi:hypothetical protein
MRLRGMVARSVPADGETVTGADLGLIDTYNRMRLSVRDVADAAGIHLGEFDQELPSLPPARAAFGPHNLVQSSQDARTAASALRSLAGYIEGLIEAVVLGKQIPLDQVHAAREAARQPPELA